MSLSCIRHLKIYITDKHRLFASLNTDLQAPRTPHLLQVSAGGLVSALLGVTTYETIWVGWPGIWVKPGPDRDSLAAMLASEGYAPVWLDPKLLDLYYNGFCNSVLWQLFHYAPPGLDSWQRMAEHKTMQVRGAGRVGGGNWHATPGTSHQYSRALPELKAHACILPENSH